MNPETFRDMINEIGNNFEPIINESTTFDVWKDKKTGKYYFCPIDKLDKDGFVIYGSVDEVELIASLHYDSTVNIINESILPNLFSNTCCGRHIDENVYLWFR